jgi:hypothetical protein
MRLHIVSTVRSSAFLTSVLSFANIIPMGLRSGRQEEEVRTDIPDRIASRLSFVASKIVEDDDTTGFEGRDQALPNRCGKSDAINGRQQDHGRARSFAHRQPQRPKQLR